MQRARHLLQQRNYFNGGDLVHHFNPTRRCSPWSSFRRNFRVEFSMDDSSSIRRAIELPENWIFHRSAAAKPTLSISHAKQRKTNTSHGNKGLYEAKTVCCIDSITMKCFDPRVPFFYILFQACRATRAETAGWNRKNEFRFYNRMRNYRKGWTFYRVIFNRNIMRNLCSSSEFREGKFFELAS